MFTHPRKMASKRLNDKAQVKKMVVAHKQCPIDYISPWEEEHHHRLIKMTLEDSKLKNKAQGPSNTLVDSFLQKIQRTKKKLTQNSRIARKYSLNTQETINTTLSLSPTLIPHTVQPLKKQWPFELVRCNTETKQSNKNNSESIEEKKQRRYRKFSLQKSVSFELQERFENQKLFDIPQNNFYNALQEDIQQNQDQRYVKKKSPNRNIKSQNIQQIQVNQKPRLFTEQEKKNPNDVVFVKKRKEKNKVTVIDMNSTAQNYYDCNFQKGKKKSKFTPFKTSSSNNQTQLSRNIRTFTKHFSKINNKNLTKFVSEKGNQMTEQNFYRTIKNPSISSLTKTSEFFRSQSFMVSNF